MSRKAVQISISRDLENRRDNAPGLVVALCDDGSIWQLNCDRLNAKNDPSKWERLPDIPDGEKQ